MPKKMGMAELHPEPLISTYLHSTLPPSPRTDMNVCEADLLPDISHVMQDSRRSTSLSKRLLKCFLHLFTGPSPLFTPPFITCPTARTSDTEIPGLFTKLGRDWQGAKKRKRKNVSLSKNGWLQRRQKAPHNVGQWKRQWEELVWMESVRK